MTTLVHGIDAARDAEAAAEILFGGDPTTASLEALLVVANEVPTTDVTRADLDDTFGVLARAQVVASTSEARRTVDQKGLRVNGAVLEKDETLASKGFLHDRYVLVRKGKTGYHLFRLV
ncbi:MAG: hypothetical protein EBX76_05335 [Acidimicrobiia bacterium]|nr:hypothetical protein [Acidimicrobiia bacterium]